MPGGKEQEGKQEKEVFPHTIEIGKSSYSLSEEALRYLTGILIPKTKYESSRSIVIANEPHYDGDAQYRVYKFLEAFFRDYPSLVPKTIFLAEGFPANQAISVRPLIEAEPNPDEELISRVLETFLIPGYVAYEWKYRKNIPIIGAEDPTLYQSSSRLWPELTEDNIRKQLEWILTCTDRNYRIVSTLLEKIKIYENPILFVGGGHLYPIDDTELQIMKKQISGDLRNFPDPAERERLMRRLEENQNKGLYNYLKGSKVWWQSVSFSSGGPESDDREENIYKRVFRAQQTGNYDDYIKWFVSEKLFGVTTRPSPETAAQFVRAYKNYLKERPFNPEAKAAYEKGISLFKAGEFIAAAEEFSAASAAEPRNLDYVRGTQASSLEEAKSRYRQLSPKLQSPGVVYKSELVIDRVPILGPYIEKDHYYKVSRFAQRFAKTPGAQEVVEHARSSGWIYRLGAAFQIKVAEVLGPKNIKGFETKYQPKGDDINKIDIVTKDNIAIECKNFIKRTVSVGQIRQWVEQAQRRFKLDSNGHKYNAVIIVIPDDKSSYETSMQLTEYLKAVYPELFYKIKVCRLSEIETVLFFTRRE